MLFAPYESFYEVQISANDVHHGDFVQLDLK